MYIYEIFMTVIVFILLCVTAYFAKDMIKQGLGLNPLPEEEPKSYSQQLQSINWGVEQGKIMAMVDGTKHNAWAIRIHDGPYVGLYYFTYEIPAAIAVDMIIEGLVKPRKEIKIIHDQVFECDGQPIGGFTVMYPDAANYSYCEFNFTDAFTEAEAILMIQNNDATDSMDGVNQ